MSDAAGEQIHVESVLDEVIRRLSSQKKSQETRDFLMEAKRLKSIALRWAAIPPPTDARREFMVRFDSLVGSLPKGVVPVEEAAEEQGPRSAPRWVHDPEDPAVGRPSIHDEETPRSAAMPFAIQDEETRREGAALALTGGQPRSGGARRPPSLLEEKTVRLGRSFIDIHDEDTAPNPAGKAQTEAIFDEDTAPAKKAGPEVEDEPTEPRSRRFGPKSQRAKKKKAPDPPAAPPPVPSAPSAPPLDGLSKTISSPSIPKASAPFAGLKKMTRATQMMPTQVPRAPIVRNADAGWRPHATAPGVRARVVAPGEGASCSALLVVDAGAVLPQRRYKAEARLVLTSGSATIGPDELGEGDGWQVSAGSLRETVATKTGCTLLFCGASTDESLKP